MNKPITYVCVLFAGNDSVPHYSRVYDASWVDKLYRGVDRNTECDIDFVCLTDRWTDFDEYVNIRQLQLKDTPGSWASMCEAWRPGVAFNRICVLGLDTIITGPIDEIVDTDCDIGLLHDPYSPAQVSNCVGIYSRAACNRLWQNWIENQGKWKTDALYNGCISEMEFLRKAVGINGATMLDDVHPGQIVSYKAHVVDHPKALERARIVYFHGKPKPHQVEDEWIKQHWI
jgi:hypothetical protein